MRSYIGITGHYTELENGFCNGGMSSLSREHSACNIYEVIQDIVVSYKISNKIS